MSAVIVESASLGIPLLGSGLTEATMADVPAVAQALRASLEALHAVVMLGQPDAPAAFPMG